MGAGRLNPSLLQQEVTSLPPMRANKSSSNTEGEQMPTEIGYKVSMAVSREQEMSWCAKDKPEELSDYLNCTRTTLIKTKTQKDTLTFWPCPSF